MKTGLPPDPYPSLDAKLGDAAAEPVFKRWTADEAKALRAKTPSVSPWRVVAWQGMAGVVITLAAWLLWDAAVALSAGYGALVVMLPAAVLARGIMSPLASMNAVNAALGFMVWEMVKIGLSVAMFFAAPQLIENLSWIALLVGVILTMKVYWVAAVYKPKPSKI
jgi:ATP synthase protein I